MAAQPPPTPALTAEHDTEPPPQPNTRGFQVALLDKVAFHPAVQSLAGHLPRATVQSGFNAVIKVALQVDEEDPDLISAAKAVNKSARELLTILRNDCTAGTHYVLPDGLDSIAMTKRDKVMIQGNNMRIKVTSAGLNHVMTYNQAAGVGPAYAAFHHEALRQSLYFNHLLKVQNDQYRAALKYQRDERLDNARALETTAAKIWCDVGEDDEFPDAATEKAALKKVHSAIAGGAAKPAYQQMHPGVTAKKAVGIVCNAENMPESVLRPNDAKSRLQLARDAFIKIEQEYALLDARDAQGFDGMDREERLEAVVSIATDEMMRLAPTVYAPKSTDKLRNLKHLYRSDAVPESKKRKFAQITSNGGTVADSAKAQKYELEAALGVRGLSTKGTLAQLKDRYNDALSVN